MFSNPQRQQIAAILGVATDLAIATVRADGWPQVTTVSFVADGTRIYFGTWAKSQKAQNIERDPRITVLIHSADNPWDWAEVRGTVTRTVDGDEARAHIDALSNKYLGHDYTNPIGPRGRVILEVTPTKVNTPRSMGR